ncbi:hypothetical protein M407DRAFT_80757, partial [Tulasnella calospora MUT 4182]
LEHMIKQDLVKGIIVEGGSDVLDICKHCIAGKQHRAPFPKMTENRTPCYGTMGIAASNSTLAPPFPFLDKTCTLDYSNNSFPFHF